MSQLSLEVTEKARKKLVALGSEGFVTVVTLGSGWCRVPVALVEGGKPRVEEDFHRLEAGDMAIWVPKDLAFRRDTVVIDYKGMLFGARIEATSALLGH